MKPCGQCQQLNPEEAQFCQHCGHGFPAAASSVPWEEPDLWRAFLGQSKAILFSFKGGWKWDRADDHYLEVFRKFTAGRTPRFALTWHWPAFIFPPFLWFLYRKMYLYAAIYLLGPILAIYLTKNPAAGSVWSLVAAFTANYVYFWHIKEQLSRLQRNPGFELQQRDRELRDLGGVQNYVIWLGLVLHVLAIGALLFLAKEGSSIELQPPLKRTVSTIRLNV
jgi:hypothetical protein